MGTLHVSRPLRLSIGVSIILDKQRLGELWPGTSLDFTVPDGEHQLRAKLGLTVSTPCPIAVSASAATHVELETPRWFEFHRVFDCAFGIGRPYFVWRMK